MFIHEWNRKICLECLSCVNACPNGNLTNYEGRPTAADINTCEGCSLCRSTCPTKAVSFRWLNDFGYSIDTPAVKNQIRLLAKSGKQRVEGMGSRRRVANFENLLFLPGQLSRLPLLDDEAVDTSVVLGKRAAKKIKLDIPLMISAMSFGAVSKEAKLALAKASAELGSETNSGEGGMLPEERRAAKHYTLQYSTGRFGITDETLKEADMVEIKIGQGAKPGVGGHLMKEKVTPEIAKTRNCPQGENIISPSRHPDIRTRDDLKAKVEYLRDATGGAPIGIKLVGGHIEKDLEIALYAGVDVITIDGTEGGTGAAPLVAREHAALPLIHLLSRASRYLDATGARDDITLIASGGLRTSPDFAKAFALGAEAINLGASVQMAMGCVRCRACHTGRCPTGICSQEGKVTLDIDKAAKAVVNFISGSVDEIKTLCRLVGKDSIHKLDKDDLAALDTETARITGVGLA